MIWIRGDLHTHTTFSDGLHNLDEAKEIAVLEGMEFIAVTDHNSFEQNKRIESDNRFAYVPGVELTTPHGHCNMIGIKEPFVVDKSRLHMNELFTTKEQVISAFQQGAKNRAFISINHPFVGDCWEWGFEDFEFDGIEIWNGSALERNEEAVRWWQEQLCLGKKLVATGGSDVHKHGMSGRYYGQGHTLVLVETVTPESIYSGLKKGWVCVASHPESSSVFFNINGYNIGDTIRLGDTGEESVETALILNISCDLKQICLLRIINDQGTVEELKLDRKTSQMVKDITYIGNTKSKFYRLELWHFDEYDQLTKPFFTNPIYIEHS